MNEIHALKLMTFWAIPIVILAIIVLPQMVRVLREYERGVIFRLGKLLRAKGPGLIFLIPVVDRMVKVDLRVITIDVPKQEMMTRDNVPVSVDAVVYFRVIEPVDAQLGFDEVVDAGEPGRVAGGIVGLDVLDGDDAGDGFGISGVQSAGGEQRQ